MVALATFAIAIATPATATATTWNVPTDAPTIAAALDSSAAGDTVLVSCGTWLEHDLPLKSGVTLRSALGDPACVTIDAQQLGRVLDGADLDDATRLEGLTITGGLAATGAFWENAGGGLRALDSALQISDCVFTGNLSKYGGGIAAQRGALHIVDTVFLANDAQADDWAAGAGLYALEGSPDLLRCTFDGNTSTSIVVLSDGGGIFADDSRLVARDCLFTGNSALAGAGGFYSFNADRSKLIDCTFSGNNAGAGGAIYFETSYAEVSGCEFIGNTARNGGAVFVAKFSAPTLEDCRFAGNEATDNSGGAFDIWQSSPLVERAEIVDNVAGLRGGGLSINSDSRPEIVDCLIARNRAGTDGGAVRAAGDAIVTMTGSSLIASESLGSGAAVHAEDTAIVDISACLIAFSAAGDPVTCSGSAAVTLTCTSVWGNAGGDWTGYLAGMEIHGGNVAADPLVCDVADSVYTVRFPDSPLLPANNICGRRIGANGVGCGCPQVATIFVPGDQPTIGAALAAAVPGDVIGVCDGTWTETIELRSGVHVVGVRSDLARIAWPAGATATALVTAPAVSDSTVLTGLRLDGGGAAPFVLEADSLSTGLRVRDNRITGGATGGVRVGPDSRLILGGDLAHANDLFDNGGAISLHLRNENVVADSLDALLNWWGSSSYWSEVIPAIEGPVRSCPSTDSTHTYVICAPPSAVSSPDPASAAPASRLALTLGPNPFRSGGVRLELVLPEASPVRLTIHDVTGRRVAELSTGDRPAGRHAVTWTGRTDAGGPAAPGVYFVRLEAASGTLTRKLVRVR